jgi:hypothetical protein
VPFLPVARTHLLRAKAHNLFEPRRFAPRPPYFVPRP